MEQKINPNSAEINARNEALALLHKADRIELNHIEKLLLAERNNALDLGTVEGRESALDFFTNQRNYFFNSTK